MAAGIIIVAVLLLCAVGVGLFFLLRGNITLTPPSSTPAPSISASEPASAPTPEAASTPEAVLSPETEPDIQEEHSAEKEPVFIPPQDVQVSVEDFSWYINYEDSGGIPPNADVIGGDVALLFGSWKGLMMYQYEFENLYNTMSCDIASDADTDALLRLYHKGSPGPDGWVDIPGELVAEEACDFEDNLLRFYLEGIYMGVLFWEDDNCQYGICHFEMDGTPCVLMLMRENQTI